MAMALAGMRPPAKAAVVGGVAVVTAAGWMFLASAIFVVGTGLWRVQHRLPSTEAYDYWRAYPNDPRVMKWVTIGAVGASLVVCAIGATLLLCRAREALHGETGFAGLAELKSRFRGRKETILCGERRGTLRYEGEQHVGLYAPTGSGKGVSIVTPNALLWDGSLVAFDPKKELYRLTAGIRAFCHQGVYLLDPLDQEGRTARYNPFSYVKRGTGSAFDDIQRIGQVLFPETSGSEDFWRSSARSTFNGVATLLAESPDLPFTIGEVYRILTRADGPQYLKRTIEDARRRDHPYSPAVISSLSDYLAGSENLVNAVRRTVTARLEIWNNPLIDQATADSDFDLRDLRKRLMAVYVGVSPDNVERLRPLLILFFQQLLDVTAQQGEPRSNPLLRRKLLILLDEFPILGRMEKVAEAFAWVRSYGVRFLMVIQSKAQLRAAYGIELARTIMENCGVEIVFGTDDLELSREISERLGYNTVSAVSRSRGGSLLSQKNGDSKTTSDQRRALMLPQEVRTLSPRKCIILSPGLRPILADRIIYYKDKTFTKLLLKAPVVTPLSAAPAAGSPRPKPVPVALGDQGASVAAATATATASPGQGRPAPVAAPSPSSAEPPPGAVPQPGEMAEPVDQGTRAPVAAADPVSEPAAASPAKKAAGRSGRRKATATQPNLSPPAPAAMPTEPAGALRTITQAAPRKPVGSEPEKPVIWATIFAAKPDLASYGLAESKEWACDMVDHLPTESRSDTLAIGAR